MGMYYVLCELYNIVELIMVCILGSKCSSGTQNTHTLYSICNKYINYMYICTVLDLCMQNCMFAIHLRCHNTSL